MTHQLFCRSKIADKFLKKNVERKKSRFVRRFQNKSVECIINKSVNRLKPIKEGVKKFPFINQNVRKCQNKNVRQLIQKDAKLHIKKSSDIKTPNDVYGLHQDQTNIAHKDLFL